MARQTTLEIAFRFAAAVGRGVLLGLERERAQRLDRGFAGARTFAIIALLGATGAYVRLEVGGIWFPLGAFGAVVVLTLASYAITAR